MNQDEGREKLGTIYIVTNLINGKQYVGQTVGKLNERKTGHYFKGNCLHNALKNMGKIVSNGFLFLVPKKTWTGKKVF